MFLIISEIYLFLFRTHVTYVNLRIYNKTNGHLYRCKKKLLEEYKNEANNESVAEELMVRLKELENRHQHQI